METENQRDRDLRAARNQALFRDERVVSNTDGYVVVQKSAAVSEITEATDPNA